ncbi:MAG: NTE family protein [Pseudomonadales bacterium]|jgi:NTE family protein
MQSKPIHQGNTALILTGGGARAAYQIGVLKAVAELLPKRTNNPFSIISGTSAGAINATAIGASANNFSLAVKKVERLWANLEVQQVYKCGPFDFFYSVIRLVGSLLHNGVGMTRPLALLNSDPLRQLLVESINFKNLQLRIDNGHLNAIGITASSYTNGESVTFYQSNDSVQPWSRARRKGVATSIMVDHLLASSAIPAILPSAKINSHYYGDGALRQVSPISPALRMGAERIMVIGVSGNSSTKIDQPIPTHSPSLAQMVGHVFNSAFIDALDNDLLQLERVNELVGMLENENPKHNYSTQKRVDLLCIQPSFDFDKLAEKHIKNMPFGMRRILKMTGASNGSGSLASYLMFDGNFCRELISNGYKDAMEQKELIEDFFYPKDISV